MPDGTRRVISLKTLSREIQQDQASREAIRVRGINRLTIKQDIVGDKADLTILDDYIEQYIGADSSRREYTSPWPEPKKSAKKQEDKKQKPIHKPRRKFNFDD